MYETPIFRIRPGVSEVRWDSWPRVTDAIASYQVFRELRTAGVISRNLRFQVGLPFPVSALNGLRADFAADYPVAMRGYQELVAREVERLVTAIPPENLAIQWDIAYETLDIEGVLPWTTAGAWDRFAEAVDRLPRLVPDEVLVGYHLCYGTFPEWPMYEARDMGVLVRMANHAVASSGRTTDWVHMAGPRYLRSEDDRFFRPFSTLRSGTPASSSGSCCRWTASPACGGARRPHQSSCPTSAWRCTAASASRPAAPPSRRSASTARSSAPSGAPESRQAGRPKVPLGAAVRPCPVARAAGKNVIDGMEARHGRTAEIAGRGFGGATAWPHGRGVAARADRAVGHRFRGRTPRRPRRAPGPLLRLHEVTWKPMSSPKRRRLS